MAFPLLGQWPSLCVVRNQGVIRSTLLFHYFRTISEPSFCFLCYLLQMSDYETAHFQLQGTVLWTRDDNFAVAVIPTSEDKITQSKIQCTSGQT